MKTIISMIILLLSVISLCVWDGIYTNMVFDTLTKETTEICKTLETEDISNKNLQQKILNLNDYWTEKMDMLSISISRKDLQPVSDYLQYLCSSITNNNQEDAITYSRLLQYNVLGLDDVTGFNFVNFL